MAFFVVLQFDSSGDDDWLWYGFKIRTQKNKQISIIVSIPMLWLGETMQGVLTGVLETVQILVMPGSIFLVEWELKRRFDEKGNLLQ